MDSIPTYSGSQIDWCGKMGVADASDLGQKRPVPEFNVRSHRTGAVMNFRHDAAVLDAEHEVLYHVYRSTAGVTVKVFND